MKERPIIFSTPMVLAIMDNRKKQTRRVMSPHYANTMPDNMPYAIENCPYGKPNDLLYVRESFFSHGKYSWYKTDVDDFGLVYLPDGSELTPKWKPSIHMPKEYARIWLRVEKIRVERVQDITKSDAIAEGARSKDFIGKWGLETMWSMESHMPESGGCLSTARMAFANFINKIHGGKNWSRKPTNLWDENPWVWVVVFSVLSTTGRPRIAKEVPHGR
jgi:hypothetical protein